MPIGRFRTALEQRGGVRQMNSGAAQVAHAREGPEAVGAAIVTRP